MHAEPIEQNGRRLKTWKEIAAFFGCDERTVRRWEEAYGLPVRRVPNSPRSAVFAYEGELRAWLNVERARVAAPESLAGDNNFWASARNGPWQAGRLPRVWVFLAVFLVLSTILGVLWEAFRTSAGEHTTVHDSPSAEAEKYYRAGLYGWQSRTPAGLTQAVDDFTQAIVRDPQYAEAYAGLATCYNLLREYTSMPPDYAFPRAKAAAERAIALDPSLPDAHTALAFVDFYWLHDTPAAQREFQRAIALAPRNATAHHWYATFLLNLRAFPQALGEIETAQRLDSESSSILADKGAILLYAGHTGEAAVLLHQLAQMAPTLSSPHRYLAVMYRARGDDAGFVREISISAKDRRHSADAAVADAARQGLARAGHLGMLSAMLHVQRQRFSELESPGYVLAQTYADLGDRARAIQNLAISLSRHEPDSVSLNIDPAFTPLRSLPAFRQLVRIAGVEPAAVRSR